MVDDNNRMVLDLSNIGLNGPLTKALDEMTQNWEDSDILIEAFKKFQALGEMAYAKISLEQIINLDSSPRNNYLMGTFLFRNKLFETDDDIKNMFKYFEDAGRKEKDSTRYKTNFGSVLRSFNLVGDALKWWNYALAQDKNDFIASINSAEILLDIKNNDYDSTNETLVGQIKYAEEKGLIQAPEYFFNNVLRIANENPDKIKKVPLGNSANSVYVFEMDGLKNAINGEKINTLKNFVFKEQKFKDVFYEGMLSDMVGFVLRDKKIEKSIYVPKFTVIREDKNNISSLVSKFDSNKTLSQFIEEYAQKETEELYKHVLIAQDLIGQYISIVHIIGTDFLEDIHKGFYDDGFNKINLIGGKEKNFPKEKYDLKEKARKRLRKLTVTDEKQKENAIEKIMNNYSYVEKILNDMPWVVSKDAHPDQWLVPEIGKLTKEPIMGLDFEYKGIMPMTNDFVNLFETEEKNPINLHEKRMFILNYASCYNATFANHFHNEIYKEKYDEFMIEFNELKNNAQRLQQEGKRMEYLAQLGYMGNLYTQFFPKEGMIENPVELLLNYPCSKIQRSMELIGAWEELGSEYHMSKRAHMLDVALEGLDELEATKHYSDIRQIQNMRAGFETLKKIIK